jgi:hypothetical protein
MLVFEKKTPIFRRKLGKIADNCDYNIDPWLFFLAPDARKITKICV